MKPDFVMCGSAQGLLNVSRCTPSIWESNGIEGRVVYEIESDLYNATMLSDIDQSVMVYEYELYEAYSRSNK